MVTPLEAISDELNSVHNLFGVRRRDLNYREVVRKDPCAFCGRRSNSKRKRRRPKRAMRTIDHIEPKSRGGRDNWSNITSSCYGCNQDKEDMNLLEFMLYKKGNYGAISARASL